MGQPFVGEIRIFAGNFAPVGWAFCDGRLLPISENEVLYQLLGTTYGGDGQNTFGVPDMRGRLPIHQGQGQGLTLRNMGEVGGAEQVTLVTNNVPAHTHPLQVSSDVAGSPNPGSSLVGRSPQVKAFINGAATVPMDPNAITPFLGGNQPHDNFQPYLCVNFIISLFGVFPSQN